MAQRRALHYVTARGGDKYDKRFFTALQKQLPDLICLGDNKPFVTDLPYWWCLLEWFAPWNRSYRPCLWIDIDTYVFHVEPFHYLDDTKLWMIRDFNSPNRSEAGIMLIPKDTDHIWDALMQLEIRPQAPAGQFIAQFPHNILQDHVEGIYSYKNHCREKRPDDAVVVCFHGVPKQPDTDGWSKQHWTTLI